MANAIKAKDSQLSLAIDIAVGSETISLIPSLRGRLPRPQPTS
jgi:hypothetical protein